MLEKLLALFRPPVATKGSTAAAEAIKINGKLIRRMREHSNSNDPVRGVLADVWAQRHNVPFMVTVYEATQEMKAPRVQEERRNSDDA